jgi:hypothetical protein
MKGASEFVLALMFIIIVATSVSLLWMYYYGYFKFIASSSEDYNVGEAISSCMRIESARNSNVYIKNCGSGTIKNSTLSVYIDDSAVGFSMPQESVDAGEIGSITLGTGSLELGSHRIKISNRNTEVERYIRLVVSDSIPVQGVLLLSFNESSGTVAYDSSPYGNNGNFFGETYSNGRTYGSTVRVDSLSGMGKALMFDDTGDFGNVSDGPNFRLPRQVTMAMWVKFYSLDPGGVCMAGKALSGHMGELDSYQMCYYPDPLYGLGGWNANSSVTVPDDIYIYEPWTPVLNRWYHIAYAFDDFANVHKLFIDGSEVESEPNYVTIGYDSRPFLIGADISNGDFFWDKFEGELDEIRVWNRTLDSQQMQAEMQSHNPVIRPAVSYSFEDTGTDVNDTHIWVSGVNGSALSFDGVNDYVNLGDRFDTLANGTIIWWANFNDNTTPSTQRFWGKHDNYEARWDGTTVHFDMGGSDTLTSSIRFERSRWYQLAIAWNSTGSYFYVDGAFRNSGGVVNLPNTADSFHIGEGGTNRGSQNFNGKIDEFQIWDIALSRSEIQDASQGKGILRGGYNSLAMGEFV